MNMNLQLAPNKAKEQKFIESWAVKTMALSKKEPGMETVLIFTLM